MNEQYIMETSEQVKQIKRSFRLFMNGVTAASMRSKGLNYKINWGVQLPDLKRMAAQYGHDAELASALWAESGVRECRLLATLIMPADKMSSDEAIDWATSADITSEIMEMAVFNLFQHLPYADSLAHTMLDNDNMVIRAGAYHLVCRLLKRGCSVSAATIEKLLDVARIDIQTTDRQLLRALVSCLQYMASTDPTQAKTAATVLNDAGFDAF